MSETINASMTSDTTQSIRAGIYEDLANNHPDEQIRKSVKDELQQKANRKLGIEQVLEGTKAELKNGSK